LRLLTFRTSVYMSFWTVTLLFAAQLLAEGARCHACYYMAQQKLYSSYWHTLLCGVRLAQMWSHTTLAAVTCMPCIYMIVYCTALLHEYITIVMLSYVAVRIAWQRPQNVLL
jgi:hypothetical protein